MRRDDSGLYALAMLMMLLFLLWASTSSQSMPKNETEPTRQEMRQEGQETSEIKEKEEPETPAQQETVSSNVEQDAKPDTKPENQPELSPEEIQKQEIEYLLGYIYGTTTYDGYETMQIDYEQSIVQMSKYTYQEYREATLEMLKEAMTDLGISDETLERYNKVIGRISNRGYLQIPQDTTLSRQGFQDGVTYSSYRTAVRELYYSKDITEEQYKEYCERLSFYEDEDNGEVEDINNETVMSKIEYAKKVLTEYGKENVTIPYFIEGT